VRAQELNEAERDAMADVLARIHRAGAAVASECGVDVAVETDDRGRFPFVGFRLHGFWAVKASPVEPGRDT
jgi:hypothetical protein